MLFNSIDFAIFLPIVFVLYWFFAGKNLKIQNAFLVLVSFVFYGWWEWRFLFLIVVSLLTDYAVGVFLAKQENEKKRKVLLIISFSVNLGLLGFFKYYNFFIENFVEAFTFLGSKFSLKPLYIILPVGISFYTFQTLSYSMDVYKRKIKPTSDIVAFAAFVSFFPQLVAGPIERASNLLPQFFSQRIFDPVKARDGLRQILYGLLKKVVIADTSAEFVNQIFSDYTEYSGSTLLLGAIFFAFQIYGDFSGYSDIAIGTAKLFGFKLMRNFAFPYFSRDIAEFWRRWHISLSTWFRDYLYIPLGGSKGNQWQKVRNVMLVFVVSGFWHGANWTFIIWGGLNALYFLPLLLTNRNRIHLDSVAEKRIFPGFRDLFKMIRTFILVVLAWIFFRSDTSGQAIGYLSGIFSGSLFSIPEVRPLHLLILLFAFILVEWFGRNLEYPLKDLETKLPKMSRWLLYGIMVFAIFYYSGKEQEFIYFQF